jgi:hypothetical protein
MSTSTNVPARLLTALACAVTVAAIVVPTSIASAPNAKYGPLDPWAYAAIHRASASAPQEILRDHGDANFARTVRVQAAREQTRQESGGFDWGTAGMSAAGAFGLIVLAGGTTLLVRRRSQLGQVRS